MQYPRTKNSFHNLILETAELEEQAGKLLLKIDENKKKIQKHFDSSNGEKKVVISINENLNVICKKSERCTITYDVDKLKKRLDDETFIEITDREYKIKDINAMIRLMKDAGVKASDFKSLIEVDIKPNKQMIKMLYDAGEISMKQLNGTYKATISKSIKIVEEQCEKD